MHWIHFSVGSRRHFLFAFIKKLYWFQFEKASEINQIDIGNEGSAFVEVLVGKSSSNDENYQVCLKSNVVFLGGKREIHGHCLLPSSHWSTLYIAGEFHAVIN